MLKSADGKEKFNGAFHGAFHTGLIVSLGTGPFPLSMSCFIATWMVITSTFICFYARSCTFLHLNFILAIVLPSFCS